VLAPRVDSYLGIDFNEASIRAAKAFSPPSNVRFAVGDATELPEGQFDVAMLVHVLEHIDDPENLLRNLSRLAPTLIVEVPDFYRCGLNPVRLDVGVDFSSDDDHVREYTEALLRDQLERAGEVVRDLVEV
jgi:SAM-dependent methyltransferase